MMSCNPHNARRLAFERRVVRATDANGTRIPAKLQYAGEHGAQRKVRELQSAGATAKIIRIPVAR